MPDMVTNAPAVPMVRMCAVPWRATSPSPAMGSDAAGMLGTLGLAALVGGIARAIRGCRRWLRRERARPDRLGFDARRQQHGGVRIVARDAAADARGGGQEDGLHPGVLGQRREAGLLGEPVVAPRDRAALNR